MKDTHDTPHPLKNWRLNAGYSQEKLGNETGLGRMTIQRIENGRMPKGVEMLKICRRTGLQPNDFYDWLAATVSLERQMTSSSKKGQPVENRGPP